MGIFPILIFVIELVFSNAATIPKRDEIATNTFYNALEEKCPLIKDVPNFRDQKIFTKCTDWKKINETHSLTVDSENEYLCLLYFDSLGIFCSEVLQLAPQQKAANITPLFTPSVEKFKVESICKNLGIFSSDKKYEHNVTQWITSESQCIKLCSTYSDSPRTECSLAYYYTNMKFTPKPKLQKAGSETEPRDVEANPQAVNPSQGQASASEPQSQGQGQVLPDKTIAPAKTEVGKSPAGVVASQPAVQPPKTGEPGAQHDKKVASPNEVHNDGLRVEKTPHQEQRVPQPANVIDQSVQKVPHVEEQPQQSSNVQDQPQQSPDVVPDQPQQSPVGEPVQPQQSTDSKVNTPNASTTQNEEKSSIAQAVVKPDEVPKTVDADPDVIDSMDLEPPVAQDVNIDNPDENSPFEDDLDEEQQYRKEEAKEEQDAKVEKPDTNNNDQDLKIAQDKTQDLLNQEPKKESNSVVMVPDDMPINAANAADIDGESYFFSYFMAICVLFVLGYVGYHNRQKVMALVVEGKRGKRQYRGRRPNSANYHKLDSNLEEAISSSVNKNSSHVIY